MHPLVIGIDLGGSKTESALAREDGAGGLEVLHRRRVATGRERGYDAILETVATLVDETAREAGPGGAALAAGVGMPGGVERRTGLVKNSNTTCLNGRPFREDLARRLAPRRVTFENDANLFALAEARLGAGRPYAAGVVFGVILGTGTGGGIVHGGRLWTGLQGIAGEWGHHSIDPAGPGCYCGGHGCVETYLAGPAVEADYARRAGGARLPLAEIAARRAADPAAAAAIERFLGAFGRALANVIDILDPSCIVLGGGVSNLDLLTDEGVARVRAAVFNDELRTPVLRHALGDSAGVLGAALLAAGSA